MTSDHRPTRAPSLTIVTITFNDPAGLAATVDSVLGAAPPIDQWVIVNGGSDKRTLELLSSLPDWVEHLSEPDKGRYDAMNKGINRCSGDLVWFLHGGDCIAAATVPQELKDFFSSSSAQWGYGDVRIRGRALDGDVDWTRAPYPARRYCLGGVPIPHQGTIFRKMFLDDVGQYDTSFGLAADQLYMLRANLLSPPAHLKFLVTLFDGSGAGTERPIRDHYRDMARARELCGLSSRANSIKSAALYLRSLASVAKRKAASSISRRSKYDD